MRSIMKSYPQTDHFSMVPIKGDLRVPCLRFCKSFPVDAYRAFGNKEEFVVLPSRGLNGQLLSFESNRKGGKGVQSRADILFN